MKISRAELEKGAALARLELSDDEVERLLLLRKATLGGRRISEVATWPTARLREIVPV